MGSGERAGGVFRDDPHDALNWRWIADRCGMIGISVRLRLESLSAIDRNAHAAACGITRGALIYASLLLPGIVNRSEWH